MQVGSNSLKAAAPSVSFGDLQALVSDQNQVLKREIPRSQTDIMVEIPDADSVFWAGGAKVDLMTTEPDKIFTVDVANAVLMDVRNAAHAVQGSSATEEPVAVPGATDLWYTDGSMTEVTDHVQF